MLLLAAALRPSSPALIDVVVASSALPPGATLSVDDLAIAQVPVDYAVPGTLTGLGDAVGRTIASGVSAGEPITESRLVTSGPRADGLHTVPVRLADPEAADLLAPGSVIDLVIASGEADGRVIAEGVRVVTVPRRATSAGLGPSTRTAGSLVVVATDRRTAVALAAVGAQPGLGVVLR